MLRKIGLFVVFASNLYAGKIQIDNSISYFNSNLSTVLSPQNVSTENLSEDLILSRADQFYFITNTNRLFYSLSAYYPIKDIIKAGLKTNISYKAYEVDYHFLNFDIGPTISKNFHLIAGKHPMYVNLTALYSYSELESGEFDARLADGTNLGTTTNKYSSKGISTEIVAGCRYKINESIFISFEIQTVYQMLTSDYSATGLSDEYQHELENFKIDRLFIKPCLGLSFER